MKKIALALLSLTLLGYGLIEDKKDISSVKNNSVTRNKPRAINKFFKKSNKNEQAIIKRNNDIVKEELKLKKLTNKYLANCLIETSLCEEIQNIKQEDQTYFNESLTPLHHEFQARLEDDASSFNNETLLRSLEINNSGIFLIILDELLNRDLNHHEKEILLTTIRKQKGDVFANALIMSYKKGLFNKDNALLNYIQGTNKNFITAHSLASKSVHLRLNREEFQNMVDASCKYKEQVDRELYNALLHTQKRQARSLGLAGIYYCNTF